jgi:WD40 repeat protein
MNQRPRWWWLLWLGPAACGGPTKPEPAFVRGAVIVHGGEGRVLSDGRVLQERSWRPGEVIEGRSAPERAECVRLFSVPLGNIGASMERGAAAPDTALAFHPDGTTLAVGTVVGEVLLLDAWTGAVRARRALSEAMVKRIAWSADGNTLYAAEQSPDATLHAMDSSTLATVGRLDLADYVERSPAPPGDDLYGVYTLPAAYGLEVLSDGSLLVAATHAWNAADGRRNRARLFRLGSDLSVQASWPAADALDGVIRSMTVGAGRVALSLGRSADGPAPDTDPTSGVLELSAGELRVLKHHQMEPLRPYFDEVYVWDALAIGGDRLAFGTGDGRLVVRAPERQITHPLGTPQLAGAIPIVTSVSGLSWAGGQLLAMTARTNIPFGAAEPSLRPPEAHPAENALFGFSMGDGLVEDWSWRGPHALQGFTVAPDGRTLVVGAGPRLTDERTDLFGAMLFDLSARGGGSDRLLATCETSGPVFFRQAATRDGRVAVATYPTPTGRGLVGAYEAVVFR